MNINRLLIVKTVQHEHLSWHRFFNASILLITFLVRDVMPYIPEGQISPRNTLSSTGTNLCLKLGFC